MKCKIKKGVGPCNFLKPRGMLQSTTASWLKLIFSNSSTHYIFYFILAGWKKKRITHLSHGIFSFFCLYRREREN